MNENDQPNERACGDCKLCCFLYSIEELGKKNHEWCRHICDRGCSIHDQPRLAACTRFRCLWLLCPDIPTSWRPDQIGCVASLRSHNVVHIWQEYPRAAYGPEADQFISSLVQQGIAVLIIEGDGQQGENRLRYPPRHFPTPPTMADLCPARCPAHPVVE